MSTIAVHTRFKVLYNLEISLQYNQLINQSIYFSIIKI